jgi:precorrin-4 methylase
MDEIKQVTDPVETEKAWEDLGRPDSQVPSATYRFTITSLTDGSLRTSVEPADEINRLSRTASTFDIYQSCKEISQDIESMMLADRVARAVVANIQPTDTSKELRERLLSALSDRGIETPKA